MGAMQRPTTVFLAFLVAGALASDVAATGTRRVIAADDGSSLSARRLPCRRYIAEDGKEAIECTQEVSGCNPFDYVCLMTNGLNRRRLSSVDGLLQGASQTELLWAISQVAKLQGGQGASSALQDPSKTDAFMQLLGSGHFRRADKVYDILHSVMNSVQQGQDFDNRVRTAAPSLIFAMAGDQSRQTQEPQDLLSDVLGRIGAVHQAVQSHQNENSMMRGGSNGSASGGHQLPTGRGDVPNSVPHHQLFSQKASENTTDILKSMGVVLPVQHPSDVMMDILQGMRIVRRLQHQPSDAIEDFIRAAQFRSLNLTDMMMMEFSSAGRVAGSAERRRLSLVSPASRPVCTAEGCGPSVASAPAVVVQRDTVTTVVRETSCPNGMSLEGGVCVGLDLCPVSYTCPRGFVESEEGDCMTESQPLVECPDRYALHRGKVCTRGTVSQATYVCDTPGYVLDSVSKVCVKEIPQPNTCPPGFTMEVGSCVQKSAPQLRCGPGQTLSPNTRECVSTHTEPAALSCPDGAMQVDGERCVVIQQEAPYCPKRYTLDMATNTCVQSVPKICGECPSGFNRNGRTCERMERSPAEPSCDSAEFELRGELCHKEIVQDSKCPAGTQKSSVNPHVCEKCVPSKPVCDEGTLRGDQCVMEVEQPGKECCAPGFKLEAGQCKRVEVSAPRLSCEGECYTVTSHPVAYACPVDSEFVQHPIQPKCVRQVKNQVCAPVVEPPQCTAEASARGVCSMTAPVAPAPATCSDVLSSDTVPAEPYCPDGGALENGRCVARVPIDPERICDVGTLDEATGQCTRTTVAPIKSECPAGSTRKGFTCVTEEFRPANFVCPDGSEETVAGVCVVRSNAVSLPPKVVKQPPTYSCPGGGLLSGKQCLFSTTVEVPQVCPIGSQEGPAGCYTTAPLVVPPPVEKPVRPSFYCASPYATLAGRQCTVIERQRAEPFCTQDAYLQDNKCVRCVPQIENPPKTLTATPKPVCDSPTAELRGCVCIEHDETESLVSCAIGFSLNPAKKCERRTDKTPLCPFGTELQGEACVRRVEVAPIVRVINGCEVTPAKKPVCYVGY